MFNSITWGILLVVIGLNMLLNALFGINIPVIKFLFAVFLIYMGVKILMPSSCRTWECKFFECASENFVEKDIDKNIDNERYKVSFTSTSIDLTSLGNLNKPKTVNIFVNFGSAQVIIPNNIPIRIKANSTFSNVVLLGKTMSSEYVNLHGYSEPLLTIFIDSTFASVYVNEYKY